MDISEKMKYKLANAMKELLVHTPVDKITVKQIVDQCDVTRPTFYRHFKDKYDLINWYFDDEAEVEKADKKEAAERAAVTYHTIKSGDTLGALARRYGTTVSKLCSLNGIKSTTILRLGRKLRVR